MLGQKITPVGFPSGGIKNLGSPCKMQNLKMLQLLACELWGVEKSYFRPLLFKSFFRKMPSYIFFFRYIFKFSSQRILQSLSKCVTKKSKSSKVFLFKDKLWKTLISWWHKVFQTWGRLMAFKNKKMFRRYCLKSQCFLPKLDSEGLTN